MRKKILSIILTTTMVLGLIPCIPCVKQVKAESSWKLVWSDEFDGDSLNTDVWTRETGGSGWGNNELQYYTDRTDNSYVSDGTLKIVAKRENYSNCRFTSARLKTAGKKSFKYGKMEARIKVNGGNQDGVWPAFWMMGDDGTAWPWCGELDIMEHANSRNYVEGTIHWNAGGSSYNTPYNHIFWGSYSVPAYYYYSDNNNGINGWHTYGVIWDENTIKWYVDNSIYLTAYLNDDNAYAFRKNHYFLLNLALGSNATGYTGNIAPNDSFQSATMEVDYVRAYSGSGELNPDGGSSQPDTDGYKSVPDKAVTTVGDCTLYAGSWDNGAMSYKGSKLSDLSIKLNSTSGNAGTWGTQLKYPMNLVQGKKYNVTLKFNSTNAGNMHWKNEGENDSVDLGTVQYNVNAGINTKTLQITADSKNTAVMEMSGMPAGTVIDNISISSVQEADSATTEKPTDAATTTEKVTETPTTHKVIDVDWSGVKYLEDGAEGGKLVNKYKAYCESDKVNIVNIQKNTDGASVIYITFPVAVSSTTAEEAKIEGAGVGFPVDSVKEGQNLFKVTLSDNSTYDVYLYEEPVKVTTVAPTTTQAPTTAAPTEKATTAVPTTQAPTTVAPTEKATTAAPTTVAPTTKIDEDDTIPAPIGLTYAGNKDLPYYFAWQAPSRDIENYNVYVDGVFAGSSVNNSINLTADVFANGNGDYTVSVRSVKNGKMSAATQITYTFKDGTGSKPTTVAPVTTVAPTEKTTTVSPVTTQAPTEKATTVDQPTQVTTTEVLTTKEPLTIDWSKVEFLKDGAEGGKLDNKYKGFSESDKVNFVNIQKNADNASVIYITFPVAVSSTTAEEAKIEGAGVGFPVDSVKEGQNLFKVTLSDNSTYDVYLYEEPVKVTTVAPTTTQAPTTAEPTEKATTAVPTTQAPTTVAPTEKATTVAPTTVAPTTKIDEDDTIPAPIGLTHAGNKDLPYYFAWQAPSTDIENYNVYVDGVFAGSTVNSSINLTADVFANGNGDYTVSVRSVKNGKMSAATQITYTFKDGTGSKPTTVAPVTTVAPTEKTTTVAPTTVAPTEKATTAVPTTQAPTTVAPTEKATTVVPTTQAPTTVAPTEKATTVVPTTQAPTTVAPTEKATTAVPTTQAPTTAAPTEKATTVEPTTVAPTTKIDEDDTIPAPIGLTYAGNKDLPYYFAWQAPSTDIENYNVYVDGVFAGSSVNNSINLTADVFANGNGDYTVSVRSVKNGKMSAATQITYTFKDGTGSKPTTVAPVTTVAPTEKATTVVPTTQAPTTVAPTEKATTAVPTTQTPTTQAPTTVAPTEKATAVVPTTQAPTTVAPTEKATTVVPTTQAPTTVAPTEKATTVVPTTQAPTTVAPTEKATTVVPTTQTPTTIAPSETGTTTKPETSKETPTVSTTVTTKTAPTVKVPKVKIKKATKKISAKKLKVTLKTAKGVKGYQVMISTSKKFKKAKVKNYKKAKFTIKKLKANKKYFIRVRAYKVVNGKVYYGKWSKRKVKFKK
ncbi:family 16 glycosylhydrolase [Eubacterium ventriosum]|uniref:family 16 glycosylhydrolase n=1 Tax=Eubacterium ventriosum TaxID=39496 RepID=UPI003522CC92